MLPGTLLRTFVAGVGAIPMSDLIRLGKVGNKIYHKITCRITTRGEDQLIGPMINNGWLQLHSARVSDMGVWLAELVLDEGGQINWERSGHFQLLPPMAPDQPPREHIDTHITFKGIQAPLSGDLTVRGTYQTKSNWSHIEASVSDPSSSWPGVPCWHFYMKESFEMLSKPMELTHPMQSLSLENKASSASSESSKVSLVLAASSAAVTAASPATPSATSADSAIHTSACNESQDETVARSEVGESCLQHGQCEQLAHTPGINKTAGCANFLPSRKEAARQAMLKARAQLAEEEGGHMGNA